MKRPPERQAQEHYMPEKACPSFPGQMAGQTYAQSYLISVIFPFLLIDWSLKNTAEK